MRDVPYQQLIDEQFRLPVHRVASLLPPVGGVYAWWQVATATAPEPSPLYVGAAKNLARAVGNDLTDSTSSSFRRRLAATLHERGELSFRFHRRLRTLDHNGELGLSAWMRPNLRLSWAVIPQPETYHGPLVAALAPAFNVHRASMEGHSTGDS